MLRLLLIFITCSIFLTGCQSLSEAGKVIRNEKINSNDEFLVKKKEPLELPPEYDKIPAPRSLKVKKDKKLSEDEKIKQILKVPETEDINKTSSNSTEEAILNRIRK